MFASFRLGSRRQGPDAAEPKPKWKPVANQRVETGLGHPKYCCYSLILRGVVESKL